MSDVADFDPLRVPLIGTHLVEASAGTGKTWSIVSLLLRAIALDGRAIDAAVVVTFTEAATRELRQRLRRRLQEALQALDGAGEADRFIETLLAETSARGLDGRLLRQRLNDAIVRCDEAWVHTIHGLCARWMSEFAFEQGVGLEAWPAEEGSALQREAVADVWRRHVVLADTAQAALLLHLFSDPETLFQRLRPLLAVRPEQIDGAEAESQLAALDADTEALRQQAMELAAAGAFDALLAHLAEPGRYHANRLRVAHREAIAQALAAAGDGMPPLDVAPFERATTAALRAALNTRFKAQGIPDLPALAWIDEWVALRAAQSALEPLVWLRKLALASREREAALRQRQRRLSFDDLVRRMRERVEGEPGQRLAQRLAARFPLAVVDEFQDTDADQYAIFRAVYRGHAEAGLFLVGDPKQAIYRFRGGDIFAYRRAMQDADQRHSLRHNRRSQPRLVDAVNALFGAREQPFVFDFIGFDKAQLPADAGPGDPRAGMVVWRLPDAEGPVAHGKAETMALNAVAAEIAGLIEAGLAPERAEPPVAVLVSNHAQAQRMRRALARFGIACAYAGESSVWTTDAARALLEAVDALAHPRDPGRQRRVLAGPLFGLDAKALDPEATDATACEHGLDALAQARQRGERSGPAAALLPLIAAAAPTALRAAEGRRWLGDALHLLDLLLDLWHEVEDLAGLGARMRQHIAEARDGGRKPPDDERPRPETDRARVQLTTVHGSKGLQFDIVFAPFLWRGAARRLKDAPARGGETVTWHQCSSPRDAPIQSVRPEPFVGAQDRLVEGHVPPLQSVRPEPFVGAQDRLVEGRVPPRSGLRQAQPERLPKIGASPSDEHWTRYADDGSLRRDPGSADWAAHAALDAREQFAESLRLAYVALTRARLRCYLVWGDTSHGSDPGRASAASPLAYLLHAGDGACADGVVFDALPPGFGAARLDAALQAWAQRANGAVEVAPLPLDVPVRRVRTQIDAEPPPPRAFAGPLDAGRRIYSYSGLFGDFDGGIGSERPDHDAAVLEVGEDSVVAPAGIGGTRFGECAHAALERIDFAAWPSPAGERAIAQACRRYGFGAEAAAFLRERIDALCRAPLIDGLRLGFLPASERVAELEFFFPLNDAALEGFFAALATVPRYARAAAGQRERLAGFMRGFIDLVARHAGRYYVFDYKTNRLGDSLADYAPTALAQAVREAGYDLQYLVYTLAVHRHLRARLGAGYDYARDFGGVCYLYLRGIDAEGGHGVFVDRPPPALVDALDRWAQGIAP